MSMRRLINRLEESGATEYDDKMLIDFMIALEESGIMAKDSHKKKPVIDVIRSIVSMSKNEFSEYIKNNPKQNVRMIYKEFHDWKQSY